MKIAIVGRGFAGLTAAIALREAGHNVSLIGPRNNRYSASIAAHGASTVKGLHEASQTLFALKLLGHKNFRTWLQKIETLAKRQVSLIEGVFERFESKEEFQIEENRIYKSRFTGTFCVDQRAAKNSGYDTVDSRNWSRNFYPQDFWIDTDEYLAALEESNKALGVSVFTENTVNLVLETDGGALIKEENGAESLWDLVVLSMGFGAGSLKSLDTEFLQKYLLGASGYTAKALSAFSKRTNTSFCAVKELKAVAFHAGFSYIGSTTDRNAISLLNSTGREDWMEPRTEENLRETFLSIYSRVIGDRLKEFEDFSAKWGVRVRTRDRVPLVGPISPEKKIYANTAYYKSGLTLTPLGADLLVNLISGKQSPDILKVMATSRFDQFA